MRGKKSHSSFGFFLISFLLMSICTVTYTTAKRFDIDNNFGSIDEFDIPELIEVNKVDLVEPNLATPSKRPGKPKPEFNLPSFPTLPQSLGLSSSWTLGSSLGASSLGTSLGSSFGSSFVPEFLAQRPPTPNSPAYYGSSSVPGNSNNNFVMPPRPSPIISSNSLTESTHSPAPTWSSQPYSPQVVLSEPSSFSPPSSVSSSQSHPQPTPTFLEEVLTSPASSQSPSPSSWLSQTPTVLSQAPAPSWTSQTPSASATAQSPPQYQWSAQPPPPQYQYQWSSQPQQQYQPSWSSPPSPSYQSSHPSKPFSLYQQLNLHLLEPSTWDKLLDQKVQLQENPEKPAYYPQQQQQYQQQQHQNLPIVFAPPPAPSSSEPLAYPIEIVAINVAGYTNTSNEILDPIDGLADYTLPGQPALPHYSNSDITIDDDKFFDNDDEFVAVDNGSSFDNDEIMQMVE